MNTTLIDREDTLAIQSDDLQNEYEQSQHRIDADDLTLFYHSGII